MSNSQSFDPRAHLINIRNGKGTSEYMEVKWRLVWFRQECPEGTIETELVHLDIDKETEDEAFVWNAEKRRSEKVVKTAKGIAIFRAVVRDGKGGVATGTKMEKAAAFGDYLEKAESGAIGRALAALGYGTQFAPELNEEHRIVDSPVERSNSNAGNQVANNANSGASGSEITPDSKATERQLSSIEKMSKYLHKPLPTNFKTMTVLQAKQAIQGLTEEYKQKQQQQAS